SVRSTIRGIALVSPSLIFSTLENRGSHSDLAVSMRRHRSRPMSREVLARKTYSASRADPTAARVAARPGRSSQSAGRVLYPTYAPMAATGTRNQNIIRRLDHRSAGPAVATSGSPERENLRAERTSVV